jgi:predicted aldo/keto reductase-like oxidoreductase
MIYNNFQNLKLSALGFGTMRLPVVGGNDAVIDEKSAEEMAAFAMERGVNYYDTAWGYHGGNSERIIGKILRNYPRDSFYLATKFPGYDLSNMNKVETIFEEQLRKCGVDYFDFYLLHNVCELNINAYLNDAKYGVFSYLMKQKEAGRIRHLGFSVHGSCDVMTRFLEAYGGQIDFGQLQLNWLDWTLQNAKAKAELLNGHNLPIWVMEPLRGGKLASLTDSEIAPLNSLRPGKSAAEWAFRFLETVPGVAVILSGMSNLEQLRGNLRIFETEEPLNDEEKAALLRIAEVMVKKITLPCTACRYCISHCPQKLDIPRLIELYNEHGFTGGGFIERMALEAMPEDRQPKDCVGCKSCEAVCPQQIEIAEAMKGFAEILRASGWVQVSEG